MCIIKKIWLRSIPFMLGTCKLTRFCNGWLIRLISFFTNWFYPKYKKPNRCYGTTNVQQWHQQLSRRPKWRRSSWVNIIFVYGNCNHNNRNCLSACGGLVEIFYNAGWSCVRENARTLSRFIITKFPLSILCNSHLSCKGLSIWI